ncbi:MAG: SLBB domain-containing protein [Planctomycetes bacterium]|nr:SLBB domain-containing protein [Planctomycetota bacterium]
MEGLPASRNRSFAWCVGALAVAGTLMGCPHTVDRMAKASAFEQVVLPPPIDEPPPQYVLGSGDLLDIQVNGLPDTAQRCRVGVDGFVRYGPCGDTTATGLAIESFSSALKVKLARFYHEPIVEIQLVSTSSRRCVVLGEVDHPGSLNLFGGERVLDLLARCGGTARAAGSDYSETLAALDEAIMVRNDRMLAVDFKALLERGDQRYNILVHPDDFIYIPSNVDRQVFVLGAVGSPDAITMKADFSVSRAVAAAGGHTRDAYADRAILIRGSRGAPTVARVDLLGILEGREPDLQLKTGDIIYVPGRTSENPRFLVDRFNESFVTAVAGRYADEVYDRIDR